MRLSHCLFVYFISLCAPAGGNGTAVCCQLCTLICIHVIVVVDIVYIYNTVYSIVSQLQILFSLPDSSLP